MNMDMFFIAMGAWIGLVVLGYLIAKYNIFKMVLNVLDWTYLEMVTHPKYDRYMFIFGDSTYMVGGSIFGAGVFELLIHQVLSWNVLIFGIIMIIGGAILKEKTKKDKK